MPERVIFHVDMDAFYASVEQRDHPELRGKPVIVGGTGRRGVVSTCSYEARVFGVHSAMPGYKAKQLCPQGIFVSPRMSVYIEVSKSLMQIFDDFSPHVEPLSLDEAFLDMSGTQKLLGHKKDVAERLMKTIKKELRLTASVGVAPNKFIAKVASDMNKPFGLTICESGNEKAFLKPLAVKRLWGVGPKAQARLAEFGIHKISDIQCLSLRDIQSMLGERFGEHLFHLSQGNDTRRVQKRGKGKSIGAERTLADDVVGEVAVSKILRPLCDEVSARLRAKNLRAKGVRLKIKTADFRSHTRQCQLPRPTCDSASLQKGLRTLYENIDLQRPIRLVGMASFGFTDDAPAVQADLFCAPEKVVQDENEKLERAIDGIKAKFGKDALVRASKFEEFGDVAPMTPKDRYDDDEI